jgi:hypothetical protein
MWVGIGLVEMGDGGGGYGPRRRRWMFRYPKGFALGNHGLQIAQISMKRSARQRLVTLNRP